MLTVLFKGPWLIPVGVTHIVKVGVLMSLLLERGLDEDGILQDRIAFFDPVFALRAGILWYLSNCTFCSSKRIATT